MVRGLVFDLDGVLVHTDELHYRAWKALAGRLGLPFTREQGDRCLGVSRMGSLEILLEGSNRSYTEREKLRMAEEKNEISHRGRALRLFAQQLETYLKK